MATSPNYGWSEPDNTSLVKDGAQAMRTLGDAIDASVWSVGQGQAGKNKMLNGAFDVWQRGTTFSAAGYTTDRWFYGYGSIGTGSISQVNVAGVANLPPAIRYALRYNFTVAGSGYFAQRIEKASTLNNQTVTLSFYARNNGASAKTFGWEAIQVFGSGGSPSSAVTTYSSSATVVTGGTFARYSVTFALPTTSGKTFGTNNDDYLEIRFYDIGVANIDFAAMQLEAGSIATPFQTASGGSIQGELAMCQRYYFDSRDGSNQPFSGYTNSTDYLLANVRYPVTMRTTPSVTIGQSSGSNYVRRISTGGQLAITVTLYPGTNSGGFSGVYCAAAPFAAAVGYDFYILASAEL